MIVLIAISIVLLVLYSVVLVLFLAENDGILSDQILQDYLDKLSDKYEIYISEYCHRIDPTYSANVNYPPTYSANVDYPIERSPKVIRLLFPYYIEYIGVIPVWSKSKSRIDAMFAKGIKSDWKRKKLGLE
jgi:hypothetical protein